MVANKVLALLHRQLLPLPKGVNVGVVKNICASNETRRKLNCDDGSHGKARLPISVLPSAPSSLFVKQASTSEKEITWYLLSPPSCFFR